MDERSPLIDANYSEDQRQNPIPAMLLHHQQPYMPALPDNNSDQLPLAITQHVDDARKTPGHSMNSLNRLDSEPFSIVGFFYDSSFHNPDMEDNLMGSSQHQAWDIFTTSRGSRGFRTASISPQVNNSSTLPATNPRQLVISYVCSKCFKMFSSLDRTDRHTCEMSPEPAVHAPMSIALSDHQSTPIKSKPGVSSLHTVKSARTRNVVWNSLKELVTGPNGPSIQTEGSPKDPSSVALLGSVGPAVMTNCTTPSTAQPQPDQSEETLVECYENQPIRSTLQANKANASVTWSTCNPNAMFIAPTQQPTKSQLGDKKLIDKADSGNSETEEHDQVQKNSALQEITVEWELKISDEIEICDQCGDICDDFTKLLDHTVAVHNTTLIQCCHCIKKTIDDASMKLHTIQAHPHLMEMNQNNCSRDVASLSPKEDKCGLPFQMANYLSPKRTTRTEIVDTSTDPMSHSHGAETELENSTDPQTSCSLQCTVCDALFPTSQELYLHREAHPASPHTRCHKDERPFLCDVCGAKFPRSSQLQVHLSAHSEVKPFQCPLCGLRLSTKSNRDRHLRVHSRERPFACRYCKKTFRQKNVCADHEKRHKQNHHIQFRSGPWAREYLRQSDGKLCCGHCEATFTESKDLYAHSQQEHPDKCGDREFSCSECDQKFRYRAPLQAHIKSEHPHTTLGYTCKYCNKKFLTSQSLHYHVQRYHQFAGKERFKCEICDKRFKLPSLMKQHLKRHGDARRYKCSQCDKTYRNKGGLQLHRMDHTGEVPFKCEQCGQGFRRHVNLRDHQNQHTGKKPYICEWCKDAFQNFSTLCKHRRNKHGDVRRPTKSLPVNKNTEEPCYDDSYYVLRPNRCDDCPKAYRDRSSLSKHRRKLHGICSKKPRRHLKRPHGETSAKSNLHDHIDQELPAIPNRHGIGSKDLLPCKHCGEAFCDQLTLEGHIGETHEIHETHPNGGLHPPMEMSYNEMLMNPTLNLPVQLSQQQSTVIPTLSTNLPMGQPYTPIPHLFYYVDQDEANFEEMIVEQDNSQSYCQYYLVPNWDNSYIENSPW